MAKRGGEEALGARERQIMDAVYQLGESSVSDILQKIDDPPSYSAVRTMVRLLESKGLLRHRQEGTRYVYRPAEPLEQVKRRALRHLMQTFFSGSAAATVTAILNPSVTSLSEDELQRLERLIQDARRKGK